MNKGRVIAIIVSIVIVLGAFALYFMRSGDEKEVQWYEYYHMENKDPYGTYAVSQLLDDYFPKQSFTVLDKSLYKTLDQSKVDVPANYICISDYIYWSGRDEDSLLSFIQNGNNAFISVKNLPATFLKKLSEHKYQETGVMTSFTSREALSLDINDGTDSTYKYLFNNGLGIDTNYTWNAISVELDSIVSSTILGTYKRVEVDTEYVNFVKIKYGKGNVYVHTMPLAFTNYYLISKLGREYAEKALSFLPEGDVYWDNVSQNYTYQPQEQNEKSPLSFILSQKSLRWAWYICLLAILLYVIFRAKRKQRIIPVIEPNINTSIMFIETIGKLYYMQNNHHKVALLKMKHFVNFIRMRYKVNLQKDMEQKIDQLAAISGVSRDIITTLFSKYQRISLLENITAHELLEFNAIIQKFYKNCK
jgi:hypothetical protein